MLWHLLILASIAGLDLSETILKKVALNGKKYPIELCNGSCQKYTAYSNVTSITKENQSIQNALIFSHFSNKWKPSVMPPSSTMGELFSVRTHRGRELLARRKQAEDDGHHFGYQQDERILPI